MGVGIGDQKSEEKTALRVQGWKPLSDGSTRRSIDFGAPRIAERGARLGWLQPHHTSLSVTFSLPRRTTTAIVAPRFDPTRIARISSMSRTVWPSIDTSASPDLKPAC